MFTINCPGEGNGQFQGPTGLTVDSQDNIIVAGDCSTDVRSQQNQALISFDLPILTLFLIKFDTWSVL